MSAFGALAALAMSCAGGESPNPGPAGASEGELWALAHAIRGQLGLESTPDAGPPPDADASDFLGEFSLTYYWMASELDDSAPRDVQLYTRHCKPLAKVTRSFGNRLAMEGTGRLRDGRTLNVAGMHDCDGQGARPAFFVVGRSKRWGVGVGKRPLSPYRSVAVDTDAIRIGTVLYIPELDGLTMPGRRPYGGFVHDGCVVADDTGGGVGQGQIDLFMALQAHYESFDRRHRIKRIQVYDGERRCAQPEVRTLPIHRNAT